MKYYDLTSEEEKILEAFDQDKLVSVADNKKIRLYRKLAANSLKKSKNINLRISEKILAKLKTKAAQQGIPYQTLASSILHRFVNE